MINNDVTGQDDLTPSSPGLQPVVFVDKRIVGGESVEFDLQTFDLTDREPELLPSEMRMTPRDFKLFLVALDSDEEPNEKLRALFTETRFSLTFSPTES